MRFLKRTTLGVAAVTLAANLTGCVPVAGGGTSHAGTHHTMVMSVHVEANGHPVAVFVDITKSDVVTRTGVHGLNRGTGQLYPASWRGKSPQQSEIDYWSGGNPTTFVFRAELQPSRVRTLGMSSGLGVVVRVFCQMKRDGHLLPTEAVSGPQVAAMTVRQAKGEMKDRVLKVSCSWTDHSA